MNTHTTWPAADTEVNAPELRPGPGTKRRHRRLAAVIVVLTIAATAVAVVDTTTAAGDGTWEQAESRRMTALDSAPAGSSSAESTELDPSSEFAELHRHLRLAPVEDSSHEFAESMRQHRWKADDRSFEEAEFARQRALASQADESSR